MQTEHKTWMPMIAIGLIAGFMLGYIAAQADPPSSALAQNTDAEQQSTIDTEAYISGAQQIVATYQQSGDAQRAYEALLALRVPGVYTVDHLTLVLAFGDVVRGADQNALRATIASLSWLSM